MSDEMRWVIALVLVALLAGCGESENSTATEGAPTASIETAPTTDETTTESSPDSTSAEPARDFDELMARLPPFDVPASPDVAAYREAAFGAFFDYCVYGKGGVDKASYVGENARLLDSVPVFPGATFDGEFSDGEPQPGYCLEGLGPVLSYETSRRYMASPSVQVSTVTDFYERGLSGWMKENRDTRPCDRVFRRGDASLSLSSCGGAVVLTADHAAHAQKRLPPAPKLPPRPYGAQYPLTTKESGSDTPTGYEAEPGPTCERISGSDVPSIIIPPQPGVRAALTNEPLKLGAGTFAQYVLVEWSFEQILGDCPPTKLHLTLASPDPSLPPFSLPFDVRARAGRASLPVLDSFREVSILRATAESVDGAQSRSVSVLIRR